MSKPLSEEKVLKKLKIGNFKDLTKDVVIKMSSMLGQMEPDVAKKAIEQFPHFTKTASEILKDFKHSLDNALESNKESVAPYYKACDSTITILQQELKNDDLTFEEKNILIGRIFEVSQMMSEKDSQNKRFITIMKGLGLTAVGVVVAGFTVALGGGVSAGMRDN